MWLRCAVSFQWLSTRTQNILCGLSLPHIYIIKMRWAYRRWQKAQEWNQATCQSCHLLHWPKGPDPNPIRCRGGKGGNGYSWKEMVIGRKGWAAKRRTEKVCCMLYYYMQTDINVYRVWMFYMDAKILSPRLDNGTTKRIQTWQTLSIRPDSFKSRFKITKQVWCATRLQLYHCNAVCHPLCSGEEHGVSDGKKKAAPCTEACTWQCAREHMHAPEMSAR